MKKIITLVLSLVLGISMIGCSSNSGKTEEGSKVKMKPVATVNGEEIPFEYYKTYVNWFKLMYESQYGYTSSVWETDMSDNTSGSGETEKVTYWDMFKQQVLESMAQTEVIYQKAKEAKALPTDEEVKESIDEFNAGLTTDEQKKQAEDAGINDEFLKYVQTRALAYDSYKAYFDENTKITDEELKSEYEENKDLYDTVNASHILVKTIDDNGNSLSDEDKAKAKSKIEEALKKVNAGEDFAELAKEYSEDGSASEGGNLGDFIYGKMVPAFSEAAFALEVGQTSGIVETEYGYHIIKLNSKSNGFDDVKNAVKDSLLSTMLNEELSQLIDEATIEPNEDLIKTVNFK